MDVVDILYAKNKFGGSGGGNPNRVQVIEGTLANPLGEPTESLSIVVLALEIINGNASATLEFDYIMNGDTLHLSSYLNGQIEVNPDYWVYRLYFMYNAISDSLNMGAFALWRYTIDEGFTLNALYAQDSGFVFDLSENASLVPTTLTIYWHPMPSNTVGQAKVGQAQV